MSQTNQNTNKPVTRDKNGELYGLKPNKLCWYWYGGYKTTAVTC